MKWTLMHGVSWDRGILIGCMLEFGSVLDTYNGTKI